jgi:hypothetical protein
MKINKLKKEDIKDFDVKSDRGLDFSKISTEYIIKNLEITVGVNYESMISSIKDKDIEVLYSSRDAFEDDLFNQSTVVNLKSNYPDSALMFIHKIDFGQFELNFKSGTNLQEIEETVLNLNCVFQDKIDDVFGVENEVFLKEQYELKESEALIDIDNGIAKKIQDRFLKYNSKGTYSILQGIINSTKHNNANHPDYGMIDSHATISFKHNHNRSKWSAEDINKENEKIENELDNFGNETGFISDYTCKHSYKSRYKIELTDKATDYLNQIKQEETKKYYKENKLDTKTHFAKESRKKTMKP